MAGPVALTAFSGYTVLCCAETGEIAGEKQGLYDFDTRVLSRWRLAIDGVAPELVAQSLDAADAWRAVLRLPREGGAAAGPRLPQDAVEVQIVRQVGPAMREAISFRNWSAEPFVGRVAIELDADFSDIGGGNDQAWRKALRVSRHWNPDQTAVEFSGRGENDGRTFERGLSVRARSAARVGGSKAGFELELALAGGGGEATIELDYISHVDGQQRCADDEHVRRGRQRKAWRRRRTVVDGAPKLAQPFETASDDLFDLRNWELEKRFIGRSDGSAWVLNAGVPTFTGFFGRDALTSAWQAALLGPRPALGAIEVAAQTQATTDDPWRDAEPGKMIHELRRGPRSELGYDPRDAYYGSQTTPHMFVLALSELWHWTGDSDVLRRYRDPALRALDWAEHHGDLDGDGFLEASRRSPKGLANQGWKDSDEAIRYADGSIAKGPVATVEEQAFYFLALQRMAEMLVELGEDEQAADFLHRADDLRRRWHDAFWMPELGFYAMALDGDKKQVTSIGSNAGHALGAGIVPVEHAAAVADRLLATDLFSGWGVRTLSAEHPSYNPFAYHLGSVWPVEQATFALGFKRYGLDDHVDRLIAGTLDAAAAMHDHRLPEALSGYPRDTLSEPVAYPQANSPQAWSASAIVQCVQIMLGIYPFAPLGLLALVRPRLPEWLPELTLRRVRVGRASVDLRFARRPDGTAAHEVVKRRGRVIVVPSGPPHSVGTPRPLSEAVMQAALSVLPLDRLRALRIALGIEPS